MKKEAILFYHIRANMGGWNEELYLSNYYAGLLSENPQDYINALKIIPTRYDALIELIRYGYFKNKREIIEIGLTHYNEILNGNDTWNKEGLFFQKREFELHKMVSIGLAKNQRYKEAVELMNSGDYLLASKKFSEAETILPKIEFSSKALLIILFSKPEYNLRAKSIFIIK